MRKAISLLALAALAAPAAQAQSQANVFQPAGGWTADYGDDYCRLIRTFSNGKDEMSLALERTQPGAMMRVLLVGNGISTFRGAEQISVGFLPAGTTQKTRYVRSETADKAQFLGLEALALTPVTPPAPGTPPAPYDRQAEQRSAEGVTAISLTEGLTSPAQFDTGSLKAPIAAMQACADDLLQVWGLDVEKHRTLTAPAIPNLAGGWLPQGMIPFGEFRKFTGGANQVRLLVDAAGKPTDCVIHTPTLAEALNERICSTLMEKATFQPAKDAGGQAMASYWFGSPMFLGPPMGGRR